MRKMSVRCNINLLSWSFCICLTFEFYLCIHIEILWTGVSNWVVPIDISFCGKFYTLLVANMSYHLIGNHPGKVCKTRPILLRFTLSVPDPIGKERFVLLIKLHEHCLLRATAYWAAGSMISSLVCNKICTALPRTCHRDAGAKPVVAIQLVIEPTGYKPAKVLANNDENFQAGVGWGGAGWALHTNQLVQPACVLMSHLERQAIGDDIFRTHFLVPYFPLCASYLLTHMVLVVTSSHIPQRSTHF